MPEFPRKNWDEYLQWSVGAYDIVIEWFLQIPGRQDLGVSFIKGWYDASLVLIAIDQSSGDGSSTAKDREARKLNEDIKAALTLKASHGGSDAGDASAGAVFVEPLAPLASLTWTALDFSA